MTQEEKDKLLKYLCAALPYGVMIQYKDFQPIKLFNIDEYCINGTYRIEFCAPYLRPMSSMTEEEKVEFCDLQNKFLLSSYYPVTNGYTLYDWLNAHHFDFWGLIPMGLAIEVTENNNPYKD